MVSTSYRHLLTNFFSLQTDCNLTDVERVRTNDLLRSPCAESFSWTVNLSDRVRNISVLKCDFESVDAQLNSLLSMLQHSKDIDKCLAYAKPLVCHAMFRDCESETGRPSLEQCVQIRDQHCKRWWNRAQDLLSYFEPTDTANCLVFPECTKYFDSQGNGFSYSFPNTASQGLHC